MDPLKIESLAKDNAKYILHPASSITALQQDGPNMVVAGECNHIVDAQGKRFLDAVAGLWCVNVGYGREALSNAMKQAADTLAYYHTFANSSNPWQVALAEKLVSVAPGKLTKVFFGSSGSDANDTLIKIAWHYHSLRGNPEKTKIIAREQAYHGTSISTASLTGLPSFHKGFPIPLDFVLRTDCPHFYSRSFDDENEADFCDRLIANIDALIQKEGPENIAAFFAEPINAAGGIIEPPKDYFPKLKTLLSSYDILLAVDEVVCGFGRLGEWFGSNVLNIEPDLMSGAKGLTSGYFPMSMAMMTEDIWDVLKRGSDEFGAFYHGYTYSGHPIGCAVALENLRIIEEEGLIEKSREMGTYLHEQLHTAFDDHPLVGEIRGQGLLAGVQLVSDKATKKMPNAVEKWPHKVAASVRESGVIVRPLPTVNTIAISPPLTFTRSNVDTLIDALVEALKVL